MIRNQPFLTAPIALAFLTLAVYAQDAGTRDANTNQGTTESCPLHKHHVAANSHHARVEKHGDQTMGFSHHKTTHHFLLLAVGGAVEVTADDVTDKTSSDAIRAHLSQIAVMFRNGDFSTPMFVHDGIPPGVSSMKLLKDKITYRYEQISSGGRLHIESTDPVALAAIHDFLRFQIEEHQTGDKLIPR